MLADTVAYLLLLVDLLVVAAALTAPLLVGWLVFRRLRGRARMPRAGQEPSNREAAAEGSRVLRRCEECQALWKAIEGHRVGWASQRLRRWVRRRSRARERPTPGWAARQGWNRCPRCLSTSVRTSAAAHR